MSDKNNQNNDSKPAIPDHASHHEESTEQQPRPAKLIFLQQKRVNSAQRLVNSANAVVKSIQTGDRENQAVAPADLTRLKQAISGQQAQIRLDQQAVSRAHQAVNTALKAAQPALQAQSSAEQAVAVSQQAVASAKKDLTVAQAALKSDNVAASQQLALAQKQIKRVQESIAKRTAELTNAQASQKSAQNNYERATQSFSNNGSSTVNSAQQLALKNAQLALNQANVIVRSAQNTLKQAKDQVATVQRDTLAAKAKIEQFSKDRLVRQVVVDNAQQILLQAKKQLSESQEKLSATLARIRPVKEKLQMHETAVSQAQQLEKADQKKLATLQAQLKNLQNPAVESTISKEKEIQANQALIKAQNNLHHQQDKLEKLLLAYPEALKELPVDEVVASDSSPIANTQHKFTAADKNRNNTEANRLGINLELAPLKISAGKTVPGPKFIDKKENLPTGVTVTWINPTKVNTDAQKPGEYTETAVVVFPDGSSQIINGQLTIIGKQDSNNSDNDLRTAHANAFHIADNLVVDANDFPVAGWKVDHGEMVSPQGERIKPAKVAFESDSTLRVKRPTSNRESYRETGNKEVSKSPSFGSMLGTATRLMFGFQGRKK